jgi:hypothetical protein
VISLRYHRTRNLQREQFIKDILFRPRMQLGKSQDMARAPSARLPRELHPVRAFAVLRLYHLSSIVTICYPVPSSSIHSTGRRRAHLCDGRPRRSRPAWEGQSLRHPADGGRPNTEKGLLRRHGQPRQGCCLPPASAYMPSSREIVTEWVVLL